MAHTPGPWEYAGYNGHDWVHEITTATRPEEERALIASVVAYPHEPRASEAIANADFIVRAVNAHDDMLEALKTIGGAFWMDGEPLQDRIAELKGIAKAAIAKAEDNTTD